jgi:uroporphyrinogen decarboxylase
MKPRDLVLAQIDHRETVPLPYTVPMCEETARKLDEYHGDSSWRGRVVPHIVKLTSIDYKRRTFVDEVHYTDGFGTTWRDHNGFPSQIRYPLTEPDFGQYRLPSPQTFMNDERRAQAIAACEAHADSYRIAGFGWGLFEQSWVLRGFENVLTDMLLEPEFYGELLDRIVEMQSGFIRELVSLPIDGIFFSDDWGDQRGVIMGAERWRRFIKPRVAGLYRQVHAAGKHVLGHCCGNIAELLPDLVEIGQDVLESVQPEAMDPFRLKRDWGDRITFWGGLGSQSIIPFGTPDELKKQIQWLIREMGKGGGYILAPAKPLQPETPVQNALAILEALENQ